MNEDKVSRKKQKEDDLAKNLDQFLKRTESAEKIAPLLDNRVEFSYIPLKNIVLDTQIRSSDDVEENLDSLIDSIKDKGVIVPVLVVKEGNKYRLIAGERRYKASLAVGAHSIPARIMEDNISEQDMVLIQLIENLQRKDLNPIDEANAYVKYYRTATGKKTVTAQEIIGIMILHGKEPSRLKKEDVLIISTLEKISMKSIPTIENQLSLLRLPLEAQERVKTGKLNITKGYIFAANIDHPLFWDLFNRDIKNPFTVEGLKKAFASKKLKKASAIGFFQRATRFYNDIEKNADSISVGQARKLHEIMKKIEEKITSIIREENEKAKKG